jgi:ABC-type transport system involved in multi-copper enzyme maturation permease subunit
VRAPENVFKEALIVARYELVSMLLSVRALLFVVIYGIVAGGVGRFFLFVDEKTNGQLTQLATMASTNREEILKKAAEEGVPTAVLEAFLTGDLPMMVLMILFFSTFVIPALVLLIGYGAVGEDLHTRFSRYVLQRVSRGSWLAGKIAAHFITCFLAILVVHGILLAAAQTIDGFDTPKTLAALPRIWAGLALFTLGYVSFTAVFSVVIKPPFAAFAVGLMALAVFWVVSKIAPLDRVWMGAIDLELWALAPRAVAIYFAHVLVFLALAWYGLKKRDV